nr:probable histone-lysine N-methyltransferase set-23 [Leptinotarsa decemlineata]
MDFLDNYDHQISGVFYFPRSIPTKEAEEINCHILGGCLCLSECKEDTNCSCVKRSGTNYDYENILDTENYIIQDNNIRIPSYECNRNCTCNNVICGNKLVQFGPRKGLVVRACDNQIKGLGLFTLRNLKAGNFVCEYAGEIITENEAKKRFEVYKELKKVNYIFCINETYGTRKQKTFIDPTVYGNIGRYINHSCNPNCKLVVIRENDMLPTLGIFANRDINENTELTYTYGDSNDNHETEEQRKPCYCNSTNCNKFLPFEAGLT